MTWQIRTKATLITSASLLAAAMLFGASTPERTDDPTDQEIGRETAVKRHLADGEEYTLPLPALLDHGRMLFTANWTTHDGAGRPLLKGTGAPLADPSETLAFPRNFNRISGPDANSCSGCHNVPFGVPGGGGDFAASVFALGQRFDFADFDHTEKTPTKGSLDESGRFVSSNSIANQRASLGMYGSGFIEMLSRQITSDLRAIRDSVPPGESRPLISKGISFGVISRRIDGSYDTGMVEGLPGAGLISSETVPPSLVVRPFHQSGAVVSLRQFTVNTLNQHHGIQATERFGIGTDPDGDGVTDEATRADVTALTVYQATMAVPGRVIPNSPKIEAAIRHGEMLMSTIGCANCHIPSLVLDRQGWIYSEPNPYNPPDTLQPGKAPEWKVDLTDPRLPAPRLTVTAGKVNVPAYTDLKLHDMCDGPEDSNAEPLDMGSAPGSTGLFAGNCRFLTKKLWGAANEPPYWHHGKLTMLREAVLAHRGEAGNARRNFEALSSYDQACVIEFLKTLQVLPPNTTELVVDERGRKKTTAR